MSSFAEAETYVLWDMDECTIPNDLDIESLYKNIKSALASEGYCGKVSIQAYGSPNHIGDEFLPEGFTFIHERKIGQRRDFRIFCDSYDYTRITPCNLMLILHEGVLDKRNGVNILLAKNVINPSEVQKLAATSVWLWKSLSSGGSPTGLNESAPAAVNNTIKGKKNSLCSISKGTNMTSDPIPNDLILEILSRLPTKSVARFRCVSKQWAQLAPISSLQRLFFALEEDGVWSFFSLPQRQKSLSLVVAAEFHTKFPPDNMRIYSHRSRQFSCGYASGLIYLYGMWIREEGCDGVPVICNPSTASYATLPFLVRYRKCYSFFGFDPINKQYKVLFMAYPSGPDANKILTFGTGKLRWRRIKCSIRHEIESEGISVNGVLYYLGNRKNWVYEETSHHFVIVCFDVRSEKFKFIYLDTCVDKFINYNGKLGVIFYDRYTDDAIELRLWVLEDLEKQEWSKYGYTLRYDRIFRRKASVVGVTATGDIVLSTGYYTCEDPFYVYYFNPERNTIQRVEIQGFGEYHKAYKNHVYTFVDNIEVGDLNYIYDAKLLQSRIYASYVNRSRESEDESEEEEELRRLRIKRRIARKIIRRSMKKKKKKKKQVEES